MRILFGAVLVILSAAAQSSVAAPWPNLRSAPYDNYQRTYGDIVGAGVHLDGEVYGAIGWRLWKNFQAVGASADSADTPDRIDRKERESKR